MYQMPTATSPIPPCSKTLNRILGIYEKFHSSYFRRKALSETLLQIHLELDNTNYLCIAPVNYGVNFARSRTMRTERIHTGSREMKNRSRDVLFMSHLGLTGCGNQRITSCGDTAFCVQACVDSGIAEVPEYGAYMEKALTVPGCDTDSPQSSRYGALLPTSDKGRLAFFYL